MKAETGLLDLFGWTPPAAEPQRAAAPAPAPPPPPAPAGRSESGALRIVRRAAPGVERVVYTRNRRVMVSLTQGGTVLRLHAAFADAAEAVVLAAATCFAGRTRRARDRAREEVRAFIRALPAAAPVRRGPRTRRLHPADPPLVARLQAEFDRVNAASFDGALPRVPLFLSGAMRRRNGHFCSSPLEIVVNRRLLTHAEPGEAEATLRHEMIHLWQHASGTRPDHGREFRAWARRLDVHPRATRPVRWAAERQAL